MGFDYTWNKKGSYRHVCFYKPGSSSGKKIPLNSASVSVEYSQMLQSYFGEQGGVL